MIDKPNLKTIIVLGAPRSGTSMTAGILSRMGVDFGRVRKPDAENPRGYYEDRDFLKLMMNIFRAADQEAHGFNPPRIADIMAQKSAFDNQIAELIQDRMTQTVSPMWGWKATTTTFTIDLFLEHLVNPYFVVVVRNPLGRADSIVNYTKNKPIYQELDRLQALNLANQYYRQIYRFLQSSNHHRSLFVSFENTVANPAKTVEEMAGFLDLQLSEEALTDIYDFVVPRKSMPALKNSMQKKVQYKKQLSKLKRILGLQPSHRA
jgi:hypothetical protein